MMPCVAMAEYICGNEEEFVNRMNERAGELGMENTTFKNCNGPGCRGACNKRPRHCSYVQGTDYPLPADPGLLYDMDGKYYPYNKQGTSEFGLANTNKLVRQYEYATGLKTGSTGEAKFLCFSYS